MESTCTEYRGPASCLIIYNLPPDYTPRRTGVVEEILALMEEDRIRFGLANNKPSGPFARLLNYLGL